MQHLVTPPSITPSSSAPDWAHPPAHEGRLLIIDDDRRMASQTAQWLCRQGYHASAAATATEALSALAREAFDVCLVDAALPDSGSQRIERALRQQADRPAVVALVSRQEHADDAIVADASLTWPAADVAILDSITDARRERA